MFESSQGRQILFYWIIMNQTGIGKIVAFYHHNEVCFGIITEVTGESCSIKTISMEQFSLPAKRLILVSKDVYSVEGDELRDFVMSIDIDSAVPNLHDIINGANTDQRYSMLQLMDQLGLVDDRSLFILHRVIRENPDYFSLKHNEVLIRNEENRGNYRLLQEQKHKAACFIDQSRKLVSLILADADTPISQEQFSAEFRLSFLDRLNQDLREKANSELLKLIKAHSTDLDLNNRIRAIRLALNDVTLNTDALVAASGLPICFNIADAIPTSDGFPGHSETSDLFVFSIDDEETMDIDDALSWEKTANGFRLGIHIADVTSRIGVSTQLFVESAKRVSSLYLPTENIPMFPERTTAEDLSLKEGNLCPALSLFMDLDESFEIQESRFVLTRVKIAKNYSYKEVDRLFSQSPWSEMNKLKMVLTRNRINGNDTSHNRFSYHFKVRNAKVEIKQIDNDSPARSLISELMILYNRSFADFTLRQGIPIIYRNIEQYLQDSTDPDSGVVNSMAFLSTKPDYHPGVGVRAYMHATSPIRRFTDLINQYQLSSYLTTGSPIYGISDLQSMITEIEKTLLLHREVITLSNRYWFLAFLGQNYLDQTLKADVTRRVKNGFVALLHRWNLKVHVVSDSFCRVGEEILLIPYETYPEEGYLRGEVIL